MGSHRGKERSPRRPSPLTAWLALAVLVGGLSACSVLSRKPDPSPGEPFANSLAMKFAWVPAGAFEMGLKLASSVESAQFDEEPAHAVTFQEGFWLGAFEVTESEFEAILGKAPPRSRGPRHPAQGVTWNEAREFCRRLAAREELPYRLPSEAEWEYACRAGTDTPFHFGDVLTSDQANFDNNERDETYGDGPVGVDRGGTIEVGTLPPNAFGLFDMHGNVSEWCEDLSHPTYAGAPTDGAAWLTGGTDEKRILRGGTFMCYARDCRSTRRHHELPSFDGGAGLRVALSQPRPPAPSP